MTGLRIGRGLRTHASAALLAVLIRMPEPPKAGLTDEPQKSKKPGAVDNGTEKQAVVLVVSSRDLVEDAVKRMESEDFVPKMAGMNFRNLVGSNGVQGHPASRKYQHRRRRNY